MRARAGMVLAVLVRPAPPATALGAVFEVRAKVDALWIGCRDAARRACSTLRDAPDRVGRGGGRDFVVKIGILSGHHQNFRACGAPQEKQIRKCHRTLPTYP